jgi:predicted ArsR family transcriptional regulator
MNGLTIAEMAKKLGIPTDTVKRRLQRIGIKAKEYAGPTAVYDKSALDAIRNVRGRGRPKKSLEK